MDGRAALHAPISGFVGTGAQRAMAQMRAGKTIVTRYQRWPYREYVDREMSLYGAPEAFDLLERAFMSLRKPRATRVEMPTVSPSAAAPSRSSQLLSATQRAQNETYSEFQVERRATLQPGNPTSQYPPMLRSANVEGEVLAQFVVDTAGRVDMSTFHVLKSTHDLFTQAVKDVLPQLKFSPAEAGGRKVRQLVQLAFPFTR